MKNIVNTFPKAIAATLILSLFHTVVGELLFWLVYYNPAIFPNYIFFIGIVLIAIYLAPILIVYNGKYLYALLFLIVFTPLLSILSLTVSESLFPLKVEEMHAGILSMTILGYNYIFIIAATILGALTKFIFQQRQKADQLSLKR